MKAQKININVELDESKPNQTGECPIFLFLSATIDRKRIRKKLFTGITVKPEYWDKTKSQIKSHVRESNIANSTINETLNKIYKIKGTMELNGEIPNPEIIIARYHAGFTKKDSIDFFEYAELHLKAKKHEYSISRMSGLRNGLNHFRNFLKGNKPINFITTEILDEFRDYCSTKLLLSNNTIHLNFCVIKKFFNLAIKDEIINSNPFSNFNSIKKEETNVSFLTLEEVSILREFYFNHKGTMPQPTKLTIEAFLVGCYTGLRRCDIRTLKYSEIINNSVIVKKMRKTKSIVRVPINKFAKELIDQSGNSLNKEGYIFDIYRHSESNHWSTIVNKTLNKAGVFKENICFHSSRHSFAVNSLILGIRFEVVSKMLGHTDFKTTAIYAKIVDSLIDNDADKWNAA